MAYKKFKNSQSDGKTAEDRALERFADIMIEKIKDMDKVDWKKPWFAAGVHPAKNLDGREYNDFNQVMLMFLQQSMGWKTSRYATFDRIKFLNYERDSSGSLVRMKDKDGIDIPDVHVNSGEKSIPVFLGLKFAEHSETKKKIDFDDYKKLDSSEQEKYILRTYFRVYNVFNLDQTSMKEDRPELYQKYVSELEDKMPEKEREAHIPEMDVLLDKGLWVCPIKQEVGSRAYYRPSTDEIVLPTREQFYKDEQFYGTALHEMTHSTGAKNRAERPMEGFFGSPEYAREELVAELSSALLCSKMGFSKEVEGEIQTQSANYLKSWLGSLQDDTKYIKSVLADVRRASSFIGERIELIGDRLERDGEKAEFSDIIEGDRLQREKLLHPEVDSSNEKGLHPMPDGEKATRTSVELSPLLRQYMDFKQTRPAFTPLFHVSGDYETYQSDAERVSKVLDIPVQESAAHLGPDGHPAKYVSFPDRDFEPYKQTLIDNNVILAVLEDQDKVEKRDSDDNVVRQNPSNQETVLQTRCSAFRR